MKVLQMFVSRGLQNGHGHQVRAFVLSFFQERVNLTWIMTPTKSPRKKAADDNGRMEHTMGRRLPR